MDEQAIAEQLITYKKAVSSRAAFFISLLKIKDISKIKD